MKSIISERHTFANLTCERNFDEVHDLRTDRCWTTCDELKLSTKDSLDLRNSSQITKLEWQISLSLFGKRSYPKGDV